MEPEKISEEKARQGNKGPQILTVLIAGLVLALIVWAGVEIYGSMIAPPNSDQPGDATPQG